MKRLPLHHLHRLRRKLRRAMSFRFHPVDSAALRAIEEWTGHRQPSPPRDPMKIPFFIMLLAVIGLFLLGMTSCATVESKVTVTALSTTAQAFAPRAVVIREEKAGTPADLRRILRGNPITRQEIAARWQPAAP